MMIRINKIVDIIESCNNVIDIGSDHAYLAINLLKNKKTKFVVNVDINAQPLAQGIKHLTQSNLVEQTLNVQNDGLKNIKSKLLIHDFDYGVIAGIGANNIVNILSDNELTIKKWILQPTKNVSFLRQWLISHSYKIIKEYPIYENKIYYMTLVAKKTKMWQFVSKNNIVLGKLQNIEDKSLYKNYLQWKLDYLNGIKNPNIQPKIKQELKFLRKRLNKYEN